MGPKKTTEKVVDKDSEVDAEEHLTELRELQDRLHVSQKHNENIRCGMSNLEKENMRLESLLQQIQGRIYCGTGK